MLESRKKKKKIGELLVEAGLVTKHMLDESLQYQQKYGGGITQYLISFGYLREEDLAGCIAKQFGVPYLPLRTYDTAAEVYSRIPLELIRLYLVVPVDVHQDTLSVVMADPLDTKALEAIAAATGMHLAVYVSTISEIADTLEQRYGIQVPGLRLAQSEMNFSKPYAGDERRKAVRMVAALRMRVPLPGRMVDTQTKNISALGILFSCPEYVVPGTHMTVYFSLPAILAGQPLEAGIQIVRCTQSQHGGYEAGAVFVKIHKRELSFILETANTQHTASDSHAKK